MATFLQLQQRVSSRLKDPNNTSVALSDVKDVINLAIKTFKKKRFWFNEGSGSVTLVINDPVIYLTSITDFYREVPNGGFVVVDSEERYILEKSSLQRYAALDYQEQGLPFTYKWEAGVYKVYFYPDQAYTVNVTYLKDYDDLSADGDTNDFTTHAEDLIMYEALSRAHAEFKHDEKMEDYFTNKAQEQADILLEYTGNLTGTGSLETEQFI